MGETKEIMRSQPSTYGLSTNDGRRSLDRRTINGRRKFLVHRQTLTDKRTRSQSCLPYRGVSHEFQYLAPKISLIQWWPGRGRAGKGAGSLLTDYPFKRLDGWFFAWIMQNFAQMVPPGGGGVVLKARTFLSQSTRPEQLFRKWEKFEWKWGKDKIMRSQPSIYGISMDDGSRGLDLKTINGRRTFLVRRRTLTDIRTWSQSWEGGAEGTI